MKTKLTRLAVGAVAIALVSSVAFAADVEEVTVTASRLPNGKLAVATQTGSFYREIRLSSTVNTAGLNLATSAGAAELEKRVNDAALATCKEITRLYPESTPDEATCAKAAAKAAMVKARKLIAAAGKGAAK